MASRMGPSYFSTTLKLQGFDKRLYLAEDGDWSSQVHQHTTKTHCKVSFFYKRNHIDIHDRYTYECGFSCKAFVTKALHLLQGGKFPSTETANNHSVYVDENRAKKGR